MPIYEYECNQCGKVTEELRPVESRQALHPCPEACPGVLVKQVSAAGGFIFKGPGFHATDYNTREGQG